MDCIFCEIVAGRLSSDQVYSDDRVIAFRDINPAAPVHVLVVPRRHVQSLLDVDAVDPGLPAAMHRAVVEVARRLGIAETGFRVIVNNGEGAGQTVGHLHYHVLGGRTLSELL